MKSFKYDELSMDAFRYRHCVCRHINRQPALDKLLMRQNKDDLDSL